MTHQLPTSRPLDNDVFFKTMRDLHPSKKQLEDLVVIEKQSKDRNRVSIKDSIKAKVRKPNRPKKPIR